MIKSQKDHQSILRNDGQYQISSSRYIYIKKPSLDDLDLVKFNDRIAKRSLEYIRG